jgi:hypothetical protein
VPRGSRRRAERRRRPVPCARERSHRRVRGRAPRPHSRGPPTTTRLPSPASPDPPRPPGFPRPLCLLAFAPDRPPWFPTSWSSSSSSLPSRLPPPRLRPPPSRLGWPARCLFGRSRKGGPARQRWTPLPRKPRRVAKSRPEAGRWPGDLIRPPSRDHHLETTSRSGEHWRQPGRRWHPSVPPSLVAPSERQLQVGTDWGSRTFLSWREGSESDRVPPDLDQRLGLASKPIAKR